MQAAGMEALVHVENGSISPLTAFARTLTDRCLSPITEPKATDAKDATNFSLR